MPKAISWRDLVRKLRLFGFTGPEWGGKHPFMFKGPRRLRIPNDHGSDISAPLVHEILRQAHINANEWDAV